MNFIMTDSQYVALNITGLVSAGFVLFGFLASRLFHRNDVADVLWGLGFSAQAMAQWMASDGPSLRAIVLWTLVILWGLRLSIYLGLRTFKKTEEDPRYAAWRKEWGNREPLFAFLKVFLLQGGVMALVTLPLAWVADGAEVPLGPWDFLGVSLFVFGFIWEWVGDTQLVQFKKNPANRGKILIHGLWGLSRHPNYFGEILMTWGLFLMVVTLPHGLVTVLSPLLMTTLLVKVSGVAMLERLWEKRGADYRSLVQAIPALIPFQMRELKIFTAIASAFVILDLIWLGGLMNAFYFREAALVARLSVERPGEWDVLLWPAGGVYFCLAFATQFFAVSRDVVVSMWRGALLGFCIYGVYDFTNLSLIKNWSTAMALVDLLWGTFLCAACAGVGAVMIRRSESEA